MNKCQEENKRLRAAIDKVRTTSVHGMYGEAPESDNFGDALDELYACLVPAKKQDKMRIVPSFPTKEMIDAAYDVTQSSLLIDDREIVGIYRSMLAKVAPL